MASREGSSSTPLKSDSYQLDFYPGLKSRMGDVDGSISLLHHLFQARNEAVEKSSFSIRVQAIIRGFLARRRKKKYLKAIFDWKLLRGRLAMQVIDVRMVKFKTLGAGVEQLKLNREVRTNRIVFSKWKTVTKQFGPLRRKMKIQAGELIQANLLNLQRKVFIAFRDGTVGKNSIKFVNQIRRVQIEEIRWELHDKLVRMGELGVVPQENIFKILYRRVLLKFLDHKKFLHTKELFHRIHQIMIVARRHRALARTTWFGKSAGKCFYAWSDWTYQARAHVNRQRWHAPRVYEARHLSSFSPHCLILKNLDWRMICLYWW